MSPDAIYLNEPVWFRAHGRDCLALVVDGRRVFARWISGGRVHLQWIEKPTLARRLGAL